MLTRRHQEGPAWPGGETDPAAPSAVAAPVPEPPVLCHGDTQRKRISQKDDDGAEEAPVAPRRHLLTLRRPNTKSILHTPKWLFRKVFALERLMGKLKAADTRGDATFCSLHIKIVYTHD